MHVSTSVETCVGCGQCALAVPEVFDQEQSEGTVVLLDPNPPEDLHPAVSQAAINCPVEAISVSKS
ncbi:ferredoxin [Streptomyces sp. NBC_00986]|uniref:ferredoxin n=1 Tax=Streptomyces sp. NBC_00986 TaxID=2903702 RepID=UPI00386F8733|nr:ferredoxin [Streptomyces sp. NBC_00986]